MGGSKEYAARIALTLASPQQFVRGRQWHIVLWRKRSSQSAQLQLLVPKAGRERLFLSYHASLYGGHLGRTWTLARLADRFYWSGMADDVRDWLSQCVACIKRKSPVGRHHPLGNIPTGHRWDRIAMDILDVCDPTPEGFRYILVIADYFSKWTEAFPMKNKCADTVADILVGNIILRFGMPLVIHSDQGREFENGLMKSLCALLRCTKTRTAPYHPESDGMIERFNRTCLMMLSMFVNDRRDNWHELLPFIMHAYRTSVHESTGYSPFRLMMGEECSLPQDVSTYMCFWRCPVISCSLWFTSELNAKDHIEGIHKFQEGHGTSFYECLRQHGIEWFGSRTFFDQRKATNQAIWMDMALARRSGQELRNSYVITKSTEHAPLRRFFKAAVDGLQLVFDRSLVTSVQPKSLLVQMREAVADCDDVSSDGSLMLLSPSHDIPEATLPAESSMDQETRDEISPVVIPRRVTLANRPLQHLEAGRLGASTSQQVRSRPAVPDLCIASSNLLSVMDPLPMDQLSRHTVAEIRSWPAADRHDLLAVANRDVRVARQNIAELLLYVDDHAAHLANCASADDDSLTLMSAELLPRLEGGIRAALEEVDTL